MDIIIEELDKGLWVAATKDGKLQGLEIDPAVEEVRWGSIYRAKVTRIDKSLDAAFVLLDKDQEAILFNADVRVNGQKGGQHPIGKLLKTGQTIAVQAKTGYLRHEDTFDFIREDKMPRVSMDITLSGRFLVFAPFLMENQVSSRIRKKKLREQLMAMMRAFEPLKGLILRASSKDTQMDILLREAKLLHTQWEKLQQDLKGDTPMLVMKGPDAFQRTIGDQAGNSIEHIDVATESLYKQVEGWCGIYGPDLVPKINLVELPPPREDLALFDHYGLLGDVEDLFQDYALLAGGGSLILQETAALTAIDVNRGGDNRPIMAVNIEAATEIARQIRLRNIGGIIIIDTLKFPKKADQLTFLKELEGIFDTDPCTVQVHGLTALGLIEITRKRRTPPLSERLDAIDDFRND